MKIPNESLYENLKAFKSKYYLNKLLKGSLVFLTILLVAFLTFNLLEYYGHFDGWIRAFFYFSFVSITFILGLIWIIFPIYQLLNSNKLLSDQEAAVQIGKLIPKVSDKLLNTLQLTQLNTSINPLITASIAQKSKELSVFNFAEVVRINENKKYLKFLLPPLLIVVLVFTFLPKLFKQGTERIIHYNKDFLSEAPFEFVLQNRSLDVFKKENLALRLKLVGSNTLPKNAYIIINNRKLKMEIIEENTYTYQFNNIEEKINFQFEAAGFYSKNYVIDPKLRPNLLFFDVSLIYPNYLNKKQENLNNIGNLLIPEGTKITWQFQTEDCNNLSLAFSDQKILKGNKKLFSKTFELSSIIKKSVDYSVEMDNKFGKSKEKITYNISVIKDQFPSIEVNQIKDTSLYHFLAFSGLLTDDYGLSELTFSYQIQRNVNISFSSDFVEKPTANPHKTIKIKISPNQNNQRFYYEWEIDSLQLKAGESLNYYFTVWDNDGINGRKPTRSQVFDWKMPSRVEVEKVLSENESATESQISETEKKAQQLKKEVKKLDQKLKGKRQLQWEDKKEIEELLKKQKTLQQELQQMQEKHQELANKKDRFDKTNERIAEKTKLLQEIMNNILDDETKKMYQELNKLLQEKNKDNEIKDMLEKLKQKDANIEKELDRALEMFKQLKFESKVENIKDKLAELAKKQEDLSDKTLDKQNKKDNDNDKNKLEQKDDNSEEKNNPSKEKDRQEELKKEQKELEKEFESVKKELNELEKLNSELENKNELGNIENDTLEISKKQEKSSEELNNKNNKKAAQEQIKAAAEMEKLSKKMEKLQQSQESQQNEENAEDLRAILDNLLHLSFEQEDIMKSFKNISQTDPRFVTLSQKQIKIKDDSKVVEDSLFALSKRVFQIQSFINKELENMKNYMSEASTLIKARKPDFAASKQQFAMTSMNNLASMLMDVLKQMQDQQQEQKGNASGKMKAKSKKQNKGNKPSLSSLQKSLNKQMEEIKKGSLKGKQLAESLAKMAQQQEQIRKMLDENGQTKDKNGKPNGKTGNEEGGGKQGDNTNQIKKEMEKSESDIVNKQLTQETLNRQQEILNRLLEHEKAQIEREMSEEREAKNAKNENKNIPHSLKQYLIERQKQVELIKTIPPSLNPYYKNEANEYFQQLNKINKPNLKQ
jgi:hypothetical protein